MTPLNGLKISVGSAIQETSTISTYLSSKLTPLIFYPNIMEADIDYDTYCLLYDSIKEYSNNLEPNATNVIIKEKIESLPVLKQTDFKYYHNLSPVVLYILFPVGIITWTNHYLKITALIHKLRGIERSLNTVHFMLKAYAG
ncbi:hypothetical protein ACI6Q2_10600 [Chitinophagaceae bacterium LWZ2-11]